MKLTAKQIEKLNKVFSRLNDDHEELSLDLAFVLADCFNVQHDLILEAYECWQIEQVETA